MRNFSQELVAIQEEQRELMRTQNMRLKKNREKKAELTKAFYQVKKEWREFDEQIIAQIDAEMGICNYADYIISANDGLAVFKCEDNIDRACRILESGKIKKNSIRVF